MAHESTRSPPPVNTADRYDYPPARDPQSSTQNRTPQYHSDSEAQNQNQLRAQASSISDGYNSDNNRFQRTQPTINAAVASAFDQAESSNALPPEVLSQITSQITQNVIQQLQATSLGFPPTSSTSVPAAPAPTAAPVPASPSTHSGGSPHLAQRNVYTPPSPQRSDERVPQSPSNTSPSKFAHPAHERSSPPLERKTVSPVSQSSRASTTNQEYRRERSQERMRDRRNTSQERRRHERRDLSREARRDVSQEKKRKDRREASQTRNREKPRDASQNRRDSETRPRGPTRLGTGDGETTVEKIWGQLFDEHGHPTMRLGSFLRGVAVHIIEDYEPAHSLVITPQKMQKYYADTRLGSELYPWHHIFDDDTSSISRLYRQVEAQHHLVQERYDQRPDIPGLTPVGFERWATLLLQAHPNQEFERLAKALKEMPINNPDNKSERFPKEISRRLFPRSQDHQIRQKLENALVDHCHIQIPQSSHNANARSSSAHRPSSTHRPSDASTTTGPPPPASGSIPERARQPYAGSTASSTTDDAIEDEDNIATPQPPIERERKPYSVQPGGGKSHAEPVGRPPAASCPPPPAAKLGRSTSSASATRPHFETPMSSTPTGTRPIPIRSHRMSNAVPPSSMADGSLPLPAEGPGSYTASSPSFMHPRTNSIAQGAGQGPPPAGLSRRTTRNRSPSANVNGFHRSENDVSSFPAYGSSYPGDIEGEGQRKAYRDSYDPSRMPAYETARGRYGYPPHEAQAGYGRTAGHYSVAAGMEEDYYRGNGGRTPGGAPAGGGYDYNQPYPPSYR